MTTQLLPRIMRTISLAGVVKDVPEAQAHGQVATGFFRICDVGTTANRPTTGMFMGYPYFDTTLGKLIIWVGGGGGMAHPAGPTNGFWTDGTGASV